MGGAAADELKRALAVLFRLEGGRALSEKEFVQFASYRLTWFKPTEAQRLLRVALDLKLVEMRDGHLHLTFDAAGPDAPVDYRPPPAILEQGPAPVPDLFRTVLDRIVARTGADRRTAVAAINTIQERMDVHVEVAALIHAREAGVDVSDLVGPVLDAVAKRLP